jgi:hypothetical protein
MSRKYLFITLNSVENRLPRVCMPEAEMQRFPSARQGLSPAKDCSAPPLKLDMGRKPPVDRSPEEEWQIVQEGFESGNVSETCQRHGGRVLAGIGDSSFPHR